MKICNGIYNESCKMKGYTMKFMLVRGEGERKKRRKHQIQMVKIGFLDTE